MKRLYVYIIICFVFSLIIPGQEINGITSAVMDEFARAKAVHFSVSQQECIPMFNKIIEDVNQIYEQIPDDEITALDAVIHDSHMYIGITHYNAGQIEDASREFRKIVLLNPDYMPDSSIISSTIINTFDKIRRESTASVNISTVPENAQVFIGSKAAGNTPVKDKRLIYGQYQLKIYKPNYAEIIRDIEVNKDISIKENLERISASLEVRTCPPDVEIYVEERPAGTTSSPGYIPANPYIYTETGTFSDPFIINEIPMGSVRITFSRMCYKTETREVYIESAEDYRIDDVVMQSSTGSIELVGDIAGARVYINDQPYSMQRNIIDNICLGEHIIKVVNDSGGVWTKKVRIDSNRRKFEEIIFKPTILWLGLYDRSGEKFISSNIEEFDRLLERMRNYNIFSDTLSNDPMYRSLFQSALAGDYGADTGDFLSMLHGKYNFDIIALGILDPLSIDREFDVYFYHFSHSRPSVIRLATKESAFMYNFIINMDKDISFTENWLGMDLISNPAGEQGLIVVRVYPGSPAESLGMENYDHILSVNGSAINQVQDFREFLAGMGIDEKVSLKISRHSKTMDAEIPVSLIPREYGYNRDMNYNLILANIYFNLRNEKRPFFKDIYYLNTGLCYMHFGLYEKALKEGFSMISSYSNLGIMHGSPELYSGICSYNIGSVDRARALFSGAVLKEESIFGDFPYYSVRNISNFYLFLIGAIQ